jgi:hypothetical protein
MAISPYGHNDEGSPEEWAAYHRRLKREEEENMTQKPDAVEIRDNRQLMKERSREVCRVCSSPDVHVDHYGKPTVKCIGYLRDERNRVTAERDALKAEVAAGKARLQTVVTDMESRYQSADSGCGDCYDLLTIALLAKENQNDRRTGERGGLSSVTI